MSGKILKIGGGAGTPGGSDTEVQFNDGSVFGGAGELKYNKATGDVSLDKKLILPVTSASNIGVIYKGADPFIHNFKHPTGGGAVPSGYNLFIGINAGNFNTGSTATNTYHASYNLGIGTNALNDITLGDSNLAVGYGALALTTTGSSNVAIGRTALTANTFGGKNMALGRAALLRNITGDDNVAIGYNALYHNLVGDDNVAIGSTALAANIGSGNVGIGNIALTAVTTGINNVGIGKGALMNLTTGNRCIGIGSYSGHLLQAGGANQTATHSMYFGYAARASTAGRTNENVFGYGAIGIGSNTFVLGNSSIITTHIKGNTGIKTTTVSEALNVGGAIRLGTSALTNAGTIRWSGTDFEGYNGGWQSLTSGGAGQWTDAGQYIHPTAADNYRILDEGTDLSTVSFDAHTTYVLTPGTTYSISATLTISNDYVTILGYGAKITKTTYCSLMLSGNHCKLIGFEFDGDSKGYDNIYVTGSYNEINGITSHHATRAGYIGIGIALTKEATPTPSAKYNVVTGCVCYNNHMGIANWKGMYNTISNNYTYNSTADGYTCDGDAATAEYAYGNIYIGNRSYNDANGIGIDSAHHCTFTGNHIRGTTTFGGITTWNIEGPCSHCTFVGNTLENNNLYGICIGDGAGGITTHCKLSGNTYHNNGSGDWYVDPDCDYNIVMEDDIYVRNNKGLYHRNAANTAWLQTLLTDAWDGVTLGKAASVVVLGTDSVNNNPVAIRVNGVNTKYISAGAADSGGAGYRMLRVPN